MGIYEDLNALSLLWPAKNDSHNIEAGKLCQIMSYARDIASRYGISFDQISATLAGRKMKTFVDHE